MKIRISAISVLLILFSTLIIYSYKDLPRTFYQQDEWSSMGHMLGGGYSAFFSRFTIIGLIGGAGRALSLPITFFMYTYFPFNTLPFVVFSIILHTANSLLVYGIAKFLSRSSLIALIAGVFFAVTSVPHQAISWFAANTTTLPSAFFVLLSIRIFLSFLKNQNKKHLYISLFLSVVSVHFKETSIFIYPLFLVLFLIYTKKQSLKKTVRELFPIVLVGILILILRIFGVLLMPKEVFTGTRFEFGRSTLFVQAFMYSLEALSQLYIHPLSLYQSALKFEKIFYPYMYHLPHAQILAESVVADMVSMFLSFVILIGSMLILRDKQNRTLLILSLTFIVLSILPVSMITRSNAYLESRYYYVSSAGAGILLGIIINKLWIVLRLYSRIGAGIALFFLMFFYYLYHISAIQKDIGSLIVLSQERRTVLSNIKRTVPLLPPKPVFYISGNKDYIVSNNKLPFQQGSGYTLMVWFYKDGNIPKQLLSEGFLWDLSSEGYRVTDDGAFGYFTTQEEILRNVRDGIIQSEQIIPLQYDPDTYAFTYNEKLLEYTY